MKFRVLLTDDAARDLEDIYQYVASRESPAAANRLLDQIEEVIQSLSRFPHRGKYPEELLAFGIREYREVLFKPFRVVYRAIGKRVFVYVIADGRRNMQTLLERRLLAGGE